MFELHQAFLATGIVRQEECLIVDPTHPHQTNCG